MNEITIECKNLKKSFGQEQNRVDVLTNINFVAHESELIMLMGPSGSGKSTLISIIAGIIKQDEGECLVLGKSINDMGEIEKTKFRGQNIGFMFQNFTLVPTLTATENAAIPLILQGVPRNAAYQKASNLLDNLELNVQKNRLPNLLSGGEQQRVAIARAYIHEPRIILVDEPTSYLDHERGKKIMNILHDIKTKNNTTLIVVTHDPRILEFADTILYIEDGKIEKRESHQMNKTIGAPPTENAAPGN